MIKKYTFILSILLLTCMFVSCKGEYTPTKDVNPPYPDSIYGKARFGYDRFN